MAYDFSEWPLTISPAPVDPMMETLAMAIRGSASDEEALNFLRLAVTLYATVAFGVARGVDLEFKDLIKPEAVALLGALH